MKKNIIAMACAAIMLAGLPAHSASPVGDEATKAEETGKILILFKSKVKPEAVQKTKDNFMKCRDNTVKEEGNLKYEQYQSSEDSTLFMLVEIWADQNAYDFHMQTPYLRQYMQDGQGTRDENVRPELIRQIMSE